MTSKERFEAIRRKRAYLTVHEPKLADLKPTPAGYRNAKRKYFSFSAEKQVRGFSSGAALGDHIRKSILRYAMSESMRSERQCVVLVKDGKLTPEGKARGINLVTPTPPESPVTAGTANRAGARSAKPAPQHVNLKSSARASSESTEGERGATAGRETTARA